MSEILRLDRINFSYGDLSVLNDISLSVTSRSVHGIVGANGAGKSTLLSIVAGYLRASGGTITFLGKDITDSSTKDRIKYGICRTFQKVELYQTLDIFDHILLAIRQKNKLANLSKSFWDFIVSHNATVNETEEAEEILATVGLSHLKNAPVSTLSLGLGRMVELARALAMNPKLVLLDEPSSGLNQEETAQFIELINNISGSSNTTFLIVEHDLTLVTAVTTALTVLDMGHVLATGDTTAVLDNSTVKHTYLGR